jgi:hypothetical protein
MATHDFTAGVLPALIHGGGAFIVRCNLLVVTAPTLIAPPFVSIRPPTGEALRNQDIADVDAINADGC